MDEDAEDADVAADADEAAGEALPPWQKAPNEKSWTKGESWKST